MNPYIIFSAHIRPSVKEENPEASFGEITRIISRRWKAVAVDDRKEWNDKAAEDKLRYEREMSTYDGNEYVVDDASTTDIKIPHHLQEHMTYFYREREMTSFIPEMKLAATNNQGEIVAGDYFKINDVNLHEDDDREEVYEFVFKKNRKK